MFHSPTYLLIRLTRAHRNLMRHKMRELGLHRGQPFVLFALHKKDGLSNSALAAFLDVTPATLTNKVKRMEKAGLVIRRRDPEDERIHRIFLTEKGRGIINAAQETALAIEAAMFAGFSVEEKAAFEAYMQRLWENIESIEALSS